MCERIGWAERSMCALYAVYKHTEGKPWKCSQLLPLPLAASAPATRSFYIIPRFKDFCLPHKRKTNEYPNKLFRLQKCHRGKYIDICTWECIRTATRESVCHFFNPIFFSDSDYMPSPYECHKYKLRFFSSSCELEHPRSVRLLNDPCFCKTLTLNLSKKKTKCPGVLTVVLLLGGAICFLGEIKDDNGIVVGIFWKVSTCIFCKSIQSQITKAININRLNWDLKLSGH